MPSREVSDEDDGEDDLHTRIPPLPGHKAHKCTDKAYLLLLCFGIACQVRITAYAYENGDVRRLTRGYDHNQTLCTNANGGRNLMYCMTRSGDLLQHWPVCVPTCPEAGTNHTHSCYRNDTGMMQEFRDYASYEVFHFCMPEEKAALGAMLQIMSDGGIEQDDVTDSVHLLLLSMQRTCLAWLPLLICANLAVVFGYVYLLLLDRCAKILIYVCEAIILLGTVGTGVWCIWEAAGYNISEYKVGLRAGTNPIAGGVVGVALLVIALCAGCTFLVANKSLDTAVGCIEASCECIFEEPSILLQPFLSLTLKVIVLTSCSAAFMQLLSAGEFVSKANGFERGVTYNTEQSFCIFVQGLLILWLLEACHACSEYALAFTTQMWYFTPYVNGHKLDHERCTVCRAYANAIGYHLGSLSLGSLLMLLTFPLRCIVGTLDAISRYTGCDLLGPCAPFRDWYRANVAKLARTAYMDVAITSSGYMIAANRAHAILEEEIQSWRVLNGTQTAFQVALIAMESLLGFVGIQLMCSAVPLFADAESQHFVSDPNSVAFASAVICGMVGTSFATVFDMVGDTILYCFATEQRRHAQLDHEAQQSRMMVQDQGYVSWMLGYGAQDSQVDYGPSVDYAPQRLRDLIQSSNAAVQTT